MAESKAAAFARLSREGNYQKFLDRQKYYMGQYPDITDDEMFFRVLREFPEKAEHFRPAFTDEEKVEMNQQKRSSRSRSSSSVFPSNFNELPAGSFGEATEWAYQNLYNTEIGPDDFPSKLAYSQWRAGQDDPKLLQQQAHKVLAKDDDGTEAAVQEDLNDQYKILKPLYAFHSIKWDELAPSADGS